MVENFDGSFIDGIGAVDGVEQLFLMRINLKIGCFQCDSDFLGAKFAASQTKGNGFRKGQEDSVGGFPVCYVIGNGGAVAVPLYFCNE